MRNRLKGRGARASVGDASVSASPSAPAAPRRDGLTLLWGPFVRPHQRLLVAAWGLRLVSSLLFLSLPWRLRVGLDFIFTTPNPSERTKQLSLMTLVYAGRAVVKHVGAYFMNRFSDSVCSNLRVAVFEALQRRPLEEMAQAGVPRLLASLTSDVDAATSGVTTNSVHLLETAAYAAGGVILCLRLNLRLTFVVVLCVLPTVALSRLARHALRATGNASSAARAEVLAAAETSLLSAELVRAYGMERPEAAIFRQAVARSVQANEEACRFGELLGGIVSFTSAVSLVAVVWAGSMEAFAGRLTAGDLIAFVYYCVEISNSTEKTFRIYSDLMSLSGAVERVASLVAPDVGGQETPSIVPSGASGRQGAALGEDDDRAVSIPLASTARPASSAQGDVEQTTQASRRGSAKAASASGRSPSPPPRAAAGGGRHPQSGAHELAAIPRSPAVRLHCAVEFRDVWFRYEGSGHAAEAPPALRGVSLSVPPGQVLALVGPSGSGKSTLLKLCMGLYSPTRGAVFVGGSNVRLVSAEHLRAQIGWVAQGDGSVLPGTVRENILFGKPTASDQEVKEAAMLAAAFSLEPGGTGFIQNLPQGFDTKLASRNALSGGMAARISLARALVRRPALLLLDEVSAGLDAVTETEVLSAVRKFASATGATVIIVAHRLVACRRVADAIAVMKAGEIVETGTHNELVDRPDGLYRTLFKLQEAIGD